MTVSVVVLMVFLALLAVADLLPLLRRAADTGPVSPRPLTRVALRGTSARARSGRAPSAAS